MRNGSPDLTAESKEARLADWLRAQGTIAIGYSGGVDSAYLAAVSVATLGADRVLAIIGRSASYPDSQWANARQVAVAIGLDVVEVDTDELNDPRYAANPSNRCYFCKTELWSRLVPLARERGIAVVADGTNADDLTGHRPGAQAAREHGVVSPLAMFEFSKDEIRDRSRALGLPTWEQPSSPCLSSRIPYGTPVTVGRLKRVERAEAGASRARRHGRPSRAPLRRPRSRRADARRARAAGRSDAMRSTLEAAVRAAGYERVELDPRGFRSGALNELAQAHGAPLSGD